MTPSTDVTVVCPVYNGRRYLRSTIDSIARQTLVPAELILVDDGSTDGSTEMFSALAAPFPIRTVRQHNQGQSAARNRGVDLATSELIAFIDQDDEWVPRHLELLVKPFQHEPDVGWTFSDFDEIDADGATVTRSFMKEARVAHPKRTLVSCVSEDLMVLPSASVMRRRAIQAVGGFDESLSGYEDDDLFVRFFRAGWGQQFLAASLTRFRVHVKSSSGSGVFLRSRLRYFEKLTHMLPNDHRLNRYYIRDAVAPRFFRTTLDDYVRACSLNAWDEAPRLFAALEHFARPLSPKLSRTWALKIARYPRLFRSLLRMNQWLPLSRNPIARFRPAGDVPATGGTSSTAMLTPSVVRGRNS